jgi:hypothetical protein
MTLTIAELDTEIEETEHRLFSLKARRNSLTALCRTPPEIIVRIIKCIQGREDSPFPLRADVTRPLDTKWRHIMLGCKYLRDVAMENPDVWAYVGKAAIPRSAMMIEMMHRSCIIFVTERDHA